MITVNGNPITVNTNFVSDISDWYNLKEIKIGNQIWSDKNFDYNPVNFNASVYTRSAVNGYDLGKQYYYPPISLNNELTNDLPAEWKWRVPTSADFQTLIDYCGGSGIAGYALKSTYGWDNGGNGIDTYGFNALPVGSAGNEAPINYAKAGSTTVFATTTTANTFIDGRYVAGAAWVVGLSANGYKMYGWLTNSNNLYIRASVRLIKDV